MITAWWSVWQQLLQLERHPLVVLHYAVVCGRARISRPLTLTFRHFYKNLTNYEVAVYRESTTSQHGIFDVLSRDSASDWSISGSISSLCVWVWQVVRVMWPTSRSMTSCMTHVMQLSDTIAVLYSIFYDISSNRRYMVFLKCTTKQYGHVLCTNGPIDQAFVTNGSHMCNLRAVACSRGTGDLPA